MPRSVSRSLRMAAGLCILAACTSSPADTIEPPDAAIDQVTGGEIIVSGKLQGDDAPDTTRATVTPPAPATSSTTRPPSSAAASTATSPPRTTARPTTTQRPTTTKVPPETDPIGDGPVLTSPGGDGTSESPTLGGGLVPAFFALKVTPTVACSTANPGTARLRWEVIGAETVDISVGSASRVFRLAQPPAGTLDVPLDCAAGSKYYVIASNAEGSTTRSVSLAADATI